MILFTSVMKKRYLDTLRISYIYTNRSTIKKLKMRKNRFYNEFIFLITPTFYKNLIFIIKKIITKNKILKNNNK